MLAVTWNPQDCVRGSQGFSIFVSLPDPHMLSLLSQTGQTLPAEKMWPATARKASVTTGSDCREMCSCRATFRYTLGRICSSSSPAWAHRGSGPLTP